MSLSVGPRESRSTVSRRRRRRHRRRRRRHKSGVAACLVALHQTLRYVSSLTLSLSLSLSVSLSLSLSLSLFQNPFIPTPGTTHPNPSLLDRPGGVRAVQISQVSDKAEYGDIDQCQTRLNDLESQGSQERL